MIVDRGSQSELLAESSCERVQRTGEREPPAFHGLLRHFLGSTFERLQGVGGLYLERLGS